jgi:hypothetical protein
MRQAMERERMHTRIGREQFQHGSRRRITLENAIQIFTQIFKHDE